MSPARPGSGYARIHEPTSGPPSPHPSTLNHEREINRYANLLPTRPQIIYAFAYIGWLKNGAVGPMPERPKGCTIAQAGQIEAAIQGYRPWG